jgi:hypothetical protein
MRDEHPSLYLQDHLDAHDFFVNQAGIIVPIQTINISPIEDKRQLNLFDNLFEDVETLEEEFSGTVVYNSSEEEN